MKTLKVLIIDDEELAREILKNYLSKIENLKLIGECGNGFEGVKSISELKPDLILLDIQMPKISGFEMLELVDNPPKIIFTTAYDEYALKAFEVNAIDYLLKPFSFERFKSAIEKVSKQDNISSNEKSNVGKLLEDVNQPEEYLNRVIVKKDNEIVIIPVEEIKYFQAQDDYVMINAEKGKYLKQQRMRYFDESLDPNSFLRIHRSYILNLSYLSKIELVEKESYKAILKDGSKIQISKKGYSRLKMLLQ